MQYIDTIGAIKSPYLIDTQANSFVKFAKRMIHIGEEIKRKAKELNLGPTELGRRINKTKSNVRDIFNRTSIDTELLKEISKALDFNFFDLYNIHEHEANYRVNAEKIILDQEQQIKDKDRTISVLTSMVEELKEKYGVRDKDTK